MEEDFQIKRNALLAAIYRKDYSKVALVYRAIWESLKQNMQVSEKDQKAVNQIQHVYNRFKMQLIPNCDSSVNDIHRKIRKHMAVITRAQVRNVSHVTYEDWVEQFVMDEHMLRGMSGTVTSLQLTVGCTNYCRRCNEWALPFVRKHFTFDAITRFLDMFFQSGNVAFSLYNASDPLNWEHGNKNIVDVMAFMSEKAYKPQFGLLTKVPGGTEEIAKSLLANGVDIGVSITKKNRSKIAWIEKNTGKMFDVQHNVDQLEIPAGLDEDFLEIKSSITDNYGTEITPEGAFMTIPTFTSALNPTGQCRIKIGPDTLFFLEKKVGRDAWPVAYFKPLDAIDIKGRKITLETLLPPQIENILQDKGSEDASPPGMMTLSEYFRTFEPAALERRKKLLLSVVKDYKQQILGKGRGDLSQQRQRFKQKVKQYIAFCRMDRVREFKKYAFSYFLKSIADYVKHHPDERDIILHLRREDADIYIKQFDSMITKSMVTADNLIETCDNDVFTLFQCMMFKLLKHPDNTEIHEFIKAYPARYDSESDRFVGLV